MMRADVLIICEVAIGVADRQFAGVADEFVYAKIRHLKAKIVGGDVFDQMRLVKNDRAVIGNDLAELIAAHIEVGKEKMVIDDDDVGGVGSDAHPRYKTRLVVRTFLADADLAFGVYPVPE